MQSEASSQEQYSQEQYSESPQESSPYYQPTIMASEKADLYDKIRPEEIVKTIRYLLMGWEWNEQTQTWRMNPVFQNIALTETGATQITTLLFPVSNKSVSISKLTDSEIRLRVRGLIRTAMKMCLRNWQEYGIRSPEQFSFVKEITLSISFITLKQPENAGVRTFIQGVTQEHRMISEAPKKEGMLGAIFRR